MWKVKAEVVSVVIGAQKGVASKLGSSKFQEQLQSSLSRRTQCECPEKAISLSHLG